MKTARFIACSLLLALGLRAQTPPAAPAPAPAGEWTLPPSVFPTVDTWYDGYLAKKATWTVPLTLGGWHWWHADRDGSFHYGTKDASGTFFFSLAADPTKIVTPGTGFVKSYGAHVEARVNDGDKFRSFFPSRLWTYDSYLWAYTDVGTFKAGQVWQRFGLDWDDSFWGGTAYFDGFKLNPDWGLSWEKTRFVNDRLTVDTFAQFYFHEDGINGAISYADPESVPGLTREHTLNLRALAKYALAEGVKFEFGVSAQTAKITSDRRDIAAQRTRGVAFDASLRYTVRKDLELRVFGEWLRNSGAISPYRYVSGGASAVIVDTILGAQIHHGPITYRSEISTGRDRQPNGRQQITINGVTIALAKNTDLYIERVRWTVRPGYLPYDLTFDDGWEVVLNWRL